jgi:hypothetical protein
LFILRNVSLQLPGGYELIAGARTEDIHLYYELAKVSVVANMHCIKLIVSVPLKTAISHFTLFRIITVPNRISSDKFVQYLFTPLILVYKTVNVTTFCSQRQISLVTVKAVLRYVQRIHLCSVLSCLRVNRVYISRLLMNISYVKRTCYLITKFQRCNSMQHCSCTISQYHAKSHWTVMEKMAEHPTHNYSVKVVYCTTLSSVTSPTTRFRRFQSYMEWRKQNLLCQMIIIPPLPMHYSIIGGHNCVSIYMVIFFHFVLFLFYI